MRVFADEINSSRGFTPLICALFALLIRSSHVHKVLVKDNLEPAFFSKR